MKKLVAFAVLLAVLAFFWQSNLSSINVTQYEKMPALYNFDSLDKCPRPSGQFENLIFDYCVVSLELDKSRSSKRAFNVIEKFSRNSTKYFKHDQPKRGICLSPCLQLNAKKKSELNKYLNDDKSLNRESAGKFEMFMGSVNKLLNVCINKDLNDTFGLSAKSSIDFCIDRNKPTPFDVVDYLFIASVSTILFMIVVATIYQRFQHRPWVITIFSRLQRTKRVIESFNVRQNWRSLLESDSSDLDCLTRFHASKFVLMFLFVCTQVYRHIASMPFANPIHVEQGYQNIWTQIIDLDVLNSVFFVVCGLHFSYEVIPLMKKSSNCWNLLKSVVGTKYRKLTGLFTAFVFLNASVLERLSLYPLWKLNALKEVHKCRNSWRLSLLSLNNYGKHDEMCIEPSWILSAELHASLISFIVLYLLVKFPRWKFVTVTTTITLSVGTMFASIYTQNLQPIYQTTPEILRNGGDERFASFYYPSHMNCGHFLISAILGCVFQSNFDLSKFMTKRNIFAFTAVYLVDFVFIKSHLLSIPSTDPIQNAIVGAVSKHRHGIFLPILIHEGFKTFGRVNYIEKLFLLSFKIVFSSCFTYAVWLPFYICNSKFGWIELTLRNTVIFVTLIFCAMLKIAFLFQNSMFVVQDMQGHLQNVVSVFKAHVKEPKKLCVRLLEIAEKLFASSFLCNCLIMKFLLFRRNTLIEMTFINVLLISTVTFILGYLLAVVVFVVIEAPFIGTSSTQAVSKTKLTTESAETTDENHLKSE